jgi:capsular polysaccharide biosynthesis protein
MYLILILAGLLAVLIEGFLDFSVATDKYQDHVVSCLIHSKSLSIYKSESYTYVIWC